MKIDSANVSMYSSTSFEYSHQSTTSAQIHIGNMATSNSGEDEKSLQSAVALDFSFSQSISIESHTRVAYSSEDNMSHEDRIKRLILEILLGRLYGDDTPMYPKAKNHGQAVSSIVSSNPYVSANPNNGSSNTQASAPTFGALFKSTEEYYQKQTVDFSTSLQINTPNQSFEMNLSLSFTKEVYEYHSTRIEVGDQAFFDPLVINYDEDINPFENLGELKFEFDLDQDGQTDQIPMLQQGAGFLAYDKNENGKIDDGGELFGTVSGNGFRDLSVHDKDGNNWIDENDQIFDKLKIWQKDDEGSGKLVSLLDLNVGAIYLGDVQSGYKYQSDIHTTEAVQKSNGVFVKEDGSGLGMVSSLDIAV